MPIINLLRITIPSKTSNRQTLKEGHFIPIPSASITWPGFLSKRYYALYNEFVSTLLMLIINSGNAFNDHFMFKPILRRGTTAGISRSETVAGKFIPALLGHAFEIALRQSIEHPNGILPSKQGFLDVLNGYGIWLQPLQGHPVPWKVVADGIKQIMTTMSAEGYVTADVGIYDSGTLVVVGQIAHRA